ncbi:hypothetical protein EJ08DRAFT_674981 [Tothia fuscella]|uniref:Uncharacterized protein n=1 Tax=Tothia fuscella TaxID=1048955 RepID=A0A9P4P1Y3_9PEZI|nr:hypothetical protein EJ08DRAFT_674981 [Tothia fuscella]
MRSQLLRLSRSRITPSPPVSNIRKRFASHDHHDAGSKESFGKGFYIAVAALPTFYIVYKLSRGSGEDQPYLTRVIKSYDHWRDTYLARNALHTQMVDQAGADRLLFLNARAADTKPVVELKHQDVFNHGSPYNVPAGQGTINLDKVIAHYEKQNAEQEQERLERAQKGGGKQSISTASW